MSHSCHLFVFLYIYKTNNINHLKKHVFSCLFLCDMYMLTCPKSVINNDEITNQMDTVMKLSFTIFPKRTRTESYFLRDAAVKFNRISNKDVKSHFKFERSFNIIAQSMGLQKTEIDRVRKIKQRLPDHTLIGVARWHIILSNENRSAQCYLFVCEGNIAYLSAPDMLFSGDTMFIDSTTRSSVYKTTYKFTQPDRAYGYINLRFDSEFTLVTKRRGVAKSEKAPSSALVRVMAENEALRRELEELKIKNT